MVSDGKSTPEQADNAESMYKCPKCGNMYSTSASISGSSSTSQSSSSSSSGKCDVCGGSLPSTKTVDASNEDY